MKGTSSGFWDGGNISYFVTKILCDYLNLLGGGTIFKYTWNFTLDFVERI